VELAPLIRKDLPELVKLSKAASPELAYLDAAGWGRQAFDDPGSDSAFLLKAVDKKAMVGAAIGVAHKQPDGSKRGFVKYVAVLPKARRRGVGTLLLSELERRFQKRECLDVRFGECPPPYVAGGVPMLATEAHCFLLGRGYQRGGTVIDMVADLKAFKADWSEADKKLIKEAGIRKATAKDAPGIQAMLRSAFPFWALEVQGALDQGSVYIALRDGQITAFACADGTHPGWFGPMGTLEVERGRGLGRLLMWKCLETLKKGGAKEARIPWVGPIPFYARYAGARLGPVFWTFSKRV
jgi:GNAT superfamily N-acetyltransferase